MPNQNDSSIEARQINAYTIELRRKAPGKDRETTYFHFPNNPLTVTVTEAARVTPQQTLKGHYLEEWGAGFKRITLEGHTGFSPRSPLDGIDEQDGYEAFVALKKLYRSYLDTTKKNLWASPDDTTQIAMILHIWEEDEHWRVVPSGEDALRRTRNDRNPLLFYYNMSFVGYTDARDDETEALGQTFMNGPSLTAILGGLLGKDSWLGQQITALGNNAAGMVKRVRDTIKNVRDVIRNVQGAIKMGVNAVKQIINTVKSVVNDITGVMRDLTKTAEIARKGISDISKGFREIRCGFEHWLKWAEGVMTTNYANEALRAWKTQEARRC